MATLLVARQSNARQSPRTLSLLEHPLLERSRAVRADTGRLARINSLEIEGTIAFASSPEATGQFVARLVLPDTFQIQEANPGSRIPPITFLMTGDQYRSWRGGEEVSVRAEARPRVRQRFAEYLITYLLAVPESCGPLGRPIPALSDPLKDNLALSTHCRTMHLRFSRSDHELVEVAYPSRMISSQLPIGSNAEPATTAAADVVSVVRLGDYRTIDGIRFPMRRAVTAGHLTTTYVARSIRVNRRITPFELTTPPQTKQ